MRHFLCLSGLFILLCSTTLQAQTAAAPASAPAGPVFDILEFDIDGNTVLDAGVIENTVYPHLGYDKRVADVESARAALEKTYHDNGYLSVAVSIPEQAVTEGVIRLQVSEGTVEKLRVSGNRYTGRSEIRAQVPALTPGSVPHYPSMQEQLGELGRTADRRVTPLLRPGRYPGRMEVELAVEDELPLHGSIELNNRQSPDTSKQRLEASLRYDNLFQRGHSANLFYVTSPQERSEVEVWLAGYRMPLSEGRSLSAYVLNSDSNIGTAADSTVVGKGTVMGLRLGLPLRTPAAFGSFFHSLSLGIDRKDFSETQSILLADRKSSPLRYAPLSLQYAFGHFSSGGEWLGNLTFSTSLRGRSRREVECFTGIYVEQFACRRNGARENFASLRGDLSYTWRALGWEVFARGDFQIAGQPLVSNEQFVAGGIDSVRGYFEGETAGDKGWRLRAEVRTPSLTEAEGFSLKSVAFIDAAGLYLVDPLPGQQSQWHLAGSGLGLRLKAPKGMQLSVDWAHALNDGATTLNGYRTARGDNRVHVRLSTSF